MDFIDLVERLLDNTLVSMVIGGLISIASQRLSVKASSLEQKRLYFVKEKTQHYYRINDLLFDLDDALSSYAGSVVRFGEELSEDELLKRDKQGVEAFEKILKLSSEIRSEGKKVRVIGSKRVASQLASIIDALDALLTKHALNAVNHDGLFVQRLHDKYMNKIDRMTDEMIQMMHEELKS